MIAHYLYCNECKDYVVNIHEHCIAIDMKLRGGVSNISLLTSGHDQLITRAMQSLGSSLEEKSAVSKVCFNIFFLKLSYI